MYNMQEHNCNELFAADAVRNGYWLGLCAIYLFLLVLGLILFQLRI